MNKIRVGFIGTGGMAGAHMGNLAQFDDVECVAMCDISEDRATGRAQEYGGTAYTDYKEMFNREDLDAVYICTPPFAHGEQEQIACENGSPMLIEKPIAVFIFLELDESYLQHFMIFSNWKAYILLLDDKTREFVTP